MRRGNQELFEVLMLKLVQKGRVISKGRVVLYPEATEFADVACIREDGDRTPAICTRCKMKAEVRHIASFDSLTIPSCPKCGCEEWQKEQASRD